MSRAAVAGVAIGAAIAAAIAGCTLHSAPPRRVTGTCGGACEYYLSCKHQPDPAARETCVQECREVFSDKKSLEAFERMSCQDVIEFVDGSPARVTAIP